LGQLSAPNGCFFLQRQPLLETRSAVRDKIRTIKSPDQAAACSSNTTTGPAPTWRPRCEAPAKICRNRSTNHASRRFIAERILEEVEAGRTALSGLQVAARLALIALRRKSLG
jgi:hypothetical protein